MDLHLLFGELYINSNEFHQNEYYYHDISLIIDYFDESEVN